jgi:hypothetical protein
MRGNGEVRELRPEQIETIRLTCKRDECDVAGMARVLNTSHATVLRYIREFEKEKAQKAQAELADEAARLGRAADDLYWGGTWLIQRRNGQVELGRVSIRTVASRGFPTPAMMMTQQPL